MLTTMVVFAVIVTSSVMSSPLQSQNACPKSAETIGLCNVVNDSSSLLLSGAQQKPGGQSPPSRPEGDGGPLAPPPPSQRAIELAKCLDEFGTTRCASLLRPESGTPPTPGIPAVTIADLARFAPAPTIASAEPGDIGIAGLPTNFVSAASAQTTTGALFGVPVTVRFTPVAYVYDYGDGSSATLTDPGRTWADLAQAQFTPTPTSHVYTRRGTYLAAVDVRYAAEVDLGTGWQSVDGVLTADGPASEIRVLNAYTALVGRTCTERPDAPGC